MFEDRERKLGELLRSSEYKGGFAEEGNHISLIAIEQEISMSNSLVVVAATQLVVKT